MLTTRDERHYLSSAPRLSSSYLTESSSFAAPRESAWEDHMFPFVGDEPLKAEELASLVMICCLTLGSISSSRIIWPKIETKSILAL